MAFPIAFNFKMKTLLEREALFYFAGVAEWLTRWPRDPLAAKRGLDK